MERNLDSAEAIEIQNQQQQTHTTFLRTCFNGFNVLSGVGILSIPYAFSQGGWLSLLILFLVAIICFYTGLLLQRCMIANPLITTYPELGQLAFGYKGRAILSAFLYLELYLVAVEFLILEGDNLEKLFPDMGFKIGNLKIGGRQGFVMMTALVIMPTTWLRNLGVLAYVSAGGILASGILTVCVLWVGAVDGVGFRARLQCQTGERGRALSLGGMPTAISLITFCFCGHAVFPTLRNSMNDKSQFSKVLLVCFISSTINYGSMAIIGYLMFGEQLKSQVTLNLPLKKLSTKIAIYTTLINPLTKYAIIIAPVATAIEEISSFRDNRFFRIVVRTGLLISTVVVALTIPFFSHIMAFIGAFLGVILSILLPCLCYLRINRATITFSLELVIIVGILVIGSFVGVLGTYTSIKQIVKSL